MIRTHGAKIKRSAAITTTTGYFATGPLPSGASPYTTSKIKGLAGGIWQAQTAAYSGDGADNAELDARDAEHFANKMH